MHVLDERVVQVEASDVTKVNFALTNLSKIFKENVYHITVQSKSYLWRCVGNTYTWDDALTVRGIENEFSMCVITWMDRYIALPNTTYGKLIFNWWLI